MILRRFFSKTIREAIAMRKHVMRLLHAQRDLMKPEALGAVKVKIAELNEAIASKANTGKIRIKTQELQFAAEKWIKIYPHAAWRENVEVLLVAIAVAMGIRTFFLQPFKIPTGSMQPTLYGVTSAPDFSQATSATINLERQKSFLTDEERNIGQAKINADVYAQSKLQDSIVIPDGLDRIRQWIHGTNYVHFVAPENGRVEGITKPFPSVIFSVYQKVKFAGKWHTIWFPPDFGEEPLEYRAGLASELSRYFHKGEDVVRLRVTAGDHLFVNRLTYNFRRPERGEIVVFETSGIDGLIRQVEMGGDPSQTNTFYIKRLVGLGGEHISLHPDYTINNSPQGNVAVGNLVANGKEITGNIAHFENLYSFSNPPKGTTVLNYSDNQYFGHALLQGLSPGSEYDIPPHHVFVMGDNTFNSSDSRYWGDFPESKIIGKSSFVYWPITKRFGWGN